MSATRIVALYPRAWRARYGEEFEALLEAGSLGLRDRVDLLRGALDAHLHPALPSPLPVVAALTASAFVTAHAIVLAAQPVPPDWPGYIEEGLPLVTLAVAAMLPAIVGLWLKLGDADGALGRLGFLVAVGGHLCWLVALVAAALRVDYGPLTAVAATVAMGGTAALGIALAGHARITLGVLLAGAALAGVAPPALGWPLFAAAWTGVAALLVVQFARGDAPRGPLVA
jgi:hypothetical protein